MQEPLKGPDHFSVWHHVHFGKSAVCLVMLIHTGINNNKWNSYFWTLLAFLSFTPKRWHQPFYSQNKQDYISHAAVCCWPVAWESLSDLTAPVIIEAPPVSSMQGELLQPHPPPLSEAVFVAVGVQQRADTAVNRTTLMLLHLQELPSFSDGEDFALHFPTSSELWPVL